MREAYLQFMVSMAKIVREDRNLTQDDEHVWEEMMQVMELERDIANVSHICICNARVILKAIPKWFRVDSFGQTSVNESLKEYSSVAENSLKMEQIFINCIKPFSLCDI